MKRIITMIVLLLALAATVYSAVTLHGRVLALQLENQARVDSAQSELDAKKTEYAAIDPNSDAGIAHQIETENQAIAEANAQAAALSEENDGFLRENDELKTQIEALEADEENAYYLTVYESLHNGMEMVEGYLNGNE